MGNQGHVFAAFIPLIIMMVPLIFICHRLAKDKGKNTVKYTILGCIPFVNYYALSYLIGTPNKIMEEKLDRILAIIRNKKPSISD